MKNKLLKIINYYGLENQLRNFSQENFELIEIILACNYDSESKYCSNYDEYLSEEIADNLILLSQFIMYYDLDFEKITDIYKEKINKQIKQINNNKNRRNKNDSNRR